MVSEGPSSMVKNEEIGSDCEWKKETNEDRKKKEEGERRNGKKGGLERTKNEGRVQYLYCLRSHYFV